MADARIQEIQSLLPRAMLQDWVRLGSRLVRLLRDQHHAATHDAIVDRLLTQARNSVALRERRREGLPRLSYPAELPITPRKDEIVEAIRKNQVVVIAGETGSGKTTQIPKMCLEAGLGIEAKVGCTQPRRVAALSISQRIAEELNSEWSRDVGCKIRFDDRSSPDTYIKLMTDGILLAETQGDPLLSEYNALIIDEAHERSLNIDFLLGYLKGLLAKRPDLKLVITSATINTEAFSKAYNDAPIIEVSGRVYPVDVVYAPFDHEREETGDITFIDAAVRATEDALCSPGDGDILIFMPGERDIRETGDALRNRIGEQAEIIPLFGRLSAGDQQRVFAPSARRKVVIATNIAETSLTIPNIRYVIDSGLARMSRYNPRTRIRRLPVEPIAQSSANQRKGRSGRVRNGVCIRLYSEEDFAARPPFTQPEIQRANLAEVILRMKAFRLGDIETFPFLNPPAPAAIQGGYKLLQELGALDEGRELTPLGRDLARLPIDPSLGRMLLQSQKEHATRELLIIASGLSIQDPRERPLEQKDTANAAHNRFADPQSDFLTLLNLWNAVHDQWETLRTQNQRRKFCKTNFLSYLRMREWQDLHGQLHGALEDLRTVRLNDSNAAYEAIHKSILAGLLGHVARRKERNIYTAPGNRQLTVFPGSSLYDRPQKTAKAAPERHSKPHQKVLPKRQPEWIVAGEIVETSQLFARTLAGIDPQWILELAPHLCQVAHRNPLWSADAGQVLAEEVTTFNNFELRRRNVAYGNINPREATEIFVRSALVENALFPEETESRELNPLTATASQLLVLAGKPAGGRVRYPFLEHNLKVRHKIETWQTRARRHDLADLDHALFDFYSQHLENVSSIHDLDRVLRESGNARFLFASENDLVGKQDLAFDSEAFPDAIRLGGQSVPLAYAYEPGDDNDGVTVQLNSALAQSVSAAAIEWAVPGLREAQIAELLRALPKSFRRELMPLPPKIADLTKNLQPSSDSLLQDLSRYILKNYGIEVPVSAWPPDALPAHLRPRIEVLGHDRKTVTSSRDLKVIREQLEEKKVQPSGDPPEWGRLVARWEKFSLAGWTFGDLPVSVREGSVEAWLGLQMEDQHLHVRLFRNPDQARRSSRNACRQLLHRELQKDLAWLEKDLRSIVRLAPLCAGFVEIDALRETALENLKHYLASGAGLNELKEDQFRAAVQQARERLPGLASRFVDLLETVLKPRAEIIRRFGSASTASPGPAKPGPLKDLRQLGATPAPVPKASLSGSISAELAALMPGDFLRRVSFDRLQHFPRYLKALATRAERAALNPVKDQERVRLVQPYRTTLDQLQAQVAKAPDAAPLVEEFRWLLEEYKVSVFAQELGTAVPVSAKRLDALLARVRELTI